MLTGQLPEESLPEIFLTEGKARFSVGNAFYRPHSQVSRDLGVLAGVVYRSQVGQLRVLDAMTGCGLRSLRYGLEAGADWIWANDGDPEIESVLRQNLNQNLNQLPIPYRVTHEAVNRVFWQCAIDRDYYDLIDIDSFGNPGSLLASCLQAVRYGGLIYLTSTDGRSISGHFPQDSLRLYGTYSRVHPSVQEYALRMLIGSLAQQAEMLGLHVVPIFSLYAGQIYRVMVRVVQKQLKGSRSFDQNYGFVAYCPQCGDYRVPEWRYLSRSSCSNHDNPVNMTLAGPLWTGNLHDRTFVQSMIDIAPELNLAHQIDLLTLFRDEAELPPYHFPLGEIGRWGKMDIPPRDRLLQALREAGYRAVGTHLSGAAIKTDAPIAAVVECARSLHETLDFS
jgi:tRNA (guanine26-N2/guanine27-N2)-dimethyltransferase